MTASELASLVQDMRNAQREFFRTRSNTALENSKRLERKVDQACKEVMDRQKTMFED